MDRSDIFDSSIAQEDRPGIRIQEENHVPSRQKLRFATVQQIKNHERLAESKNQKMMNLHPTLFHEDDFGQSNDIHFIGTQQQQYFLVDKNKQDALDIIERSQRQWQLKLPFSNIIQHSTLKLQLNRWKYNRTFTLQHRQGGSPKAVGFKYTFTLLDGSLLLKVWIQLDGVYKVWKDMEVPISQDKITLEFEEFNNQQTDVKINDLIFHLVLKMPYYRESHCYLLHDKAADIERLQFTRKRQGQYLEVSQTNCSNECQLI